MRIVKPYGQSRVESGNQQDRKRVLRTKLQIEPRDRDVAAFALSHDELVIAQWISAIDKIATKPTGPQGATAAQRDFRDRLGMAAWAFIVENKLLQGLADKDRVVYLKQLWDFKIAPYGKRDFRAKGRQREPDPRGRWYKRFADESAVENVDAAKIAKMLHEHLYVSEYRISPDAKNHRAGRIQARAQSISKNVLKQDQKQTGEWTDADLAEYEKSGDVAKRIKRDATDLEQATPPRRVSLRVSGEVLFHHYAKIFSDGNGGTLSIEQARQSKPGLFALHMAVKDCYSRLLKRHRKDQKGHAQRRKVSTLLPDDMEELAKLLTRQKTNCDLNHLIRLGKVIHYHSYHYGGPVTNWPNLDTSEYWSSDGQARIKRNEAFVRIWRHILALAQRTLTDWVDPEHTIEGDILGKKEWEQAITSIDPERLEQKLRLLFGNGASNLSRTGDHAFNGKVLGLAREVVSSLRNNAFHFTAFESFVSALSQDVAAQDPDALKATDSLWQADIRERFARLKKELESADAQFYLTSVQWSHLIEGLTQVETGDLPLPRFRHILHRAEAVRQNTKDWVALPASANRKQLENPALRCQYVSMKLVYDRAFRPWLEMQDTEKLQAFIDRAIPRATEAARAINGRGLTDSERKLIKARAESLPRIESGDGIWTFFFNLSAATASEMRVQRGYDHNAEQARKQAGFIEDLKCDVVALAFDAFLTERGFDYLRNLNAENAKPTDPKVDPEKTVLPTPSADAETWQTALYFVIHLVPVDEIGRLLHQVRKWHLLAKDDSASKATLEVASQISDVLELYLDMHDAKFEGGEGLKDLDAFKAFFENADDFGRVFPPDHPDEDVSRPYRGLREIMRFGHLGTLTEVAKAHPITSSMVDAVMDAERVEGETSKLATWQTRREELHAKWIKAGRQGLDADDLRAYVEALANVTDHRHRSGFVTLRDHVRLHRVLMAVIGRLIDYAGLWERDLYFVTLALIWEARSRPDQIFDHVRRMKGKKEEWQSGLEAFSDGQIVFALRRMYDSSTKVDALRASLHHFFGPVSVTGKGQQSEEVGIRNQLAHFVMLRPKKVAKLNLTECVNEARQLMAYDRKLKNAVTQSIKELLDREGIILSWTIKSAQLHQLDNAVLQAKSAEHLGKKRLTLQETVDRGRTKPIPIAENLHSAPFMEMAARLFRGKAVSDTQSVTHLNVSTVDWQASTATREPNRNRERENRAQWQHKRPRRGGNFRGKSR